MALSLSPSLPPSAPFLTQNRPEAHSPKSARSALLVWIEIYKAQAELLEHKLIVRITEGKVTETETGVAIN